ncbi:hypothetical protein C8F04DRAFT_1194100 [Mycena alexandri]|uniref:Uncharacterized protein n=1 Tax=Mycena alexandri TaxID=1745969 RepID=A0AAD6SA00_9AGAR|nr:hypothetical protein C8F04DRAFT_1194100 [Mycena alexandri]
MTANTCREMVLYQPVYRAENDNEIPPLISDEDWTDHMARKLVLAYHEPILFAACDSSYILKKKCQYTLCTSAGSSLQKGERYANIDYCYSQIQADGQLVLSYDYSCQFVACARHQMKRVVNARETQGWSAYQWRVRFSLILEAGTQEEYIEVGKFWCRLETYASVSDRLRLPYC